MAAAQQLAGHEKDLGGGFRVRRLLPAARRRSVGPFVFFDHFGPVTEEPQANHDVRPHPHIGLATVTYLFEGAMMHRDSLGTEQLIEPGAINWMTAGSGIVHSERKPDHLRTQPYVNHGLQLWVALPAEKEEIGASFVHTPAQAIPEVRADGALVRVLVGEAFGVRSPVEPASPTVYLDIALPQGGAFGLPPLAPELAVYPIAGVLSLDGEPMPPQQMLVLAPGAAARIEAAGPARLVVVGGETVGPRFMYWNFVSSRQDRILQASADWEAGRFGRVPGESEFIPLPPTRFTPPEPMS
ncbi:MAG TPA: pirin family protein [Ramlibacter sp.]|jgi:redox-sensitive bicupin YhaK (pirin superfamily)|uniref:pirin family protein n=1 Tax=Ramlibacter sp. TaxID=1917967 RepID=UPI002D5AAEE4|nr:pirin family protein [Ramlibacter sp.]HZY19514.1 pirin family protein [Ramlibacter sp.]